MDMLLLFCSIEELKISLTLGEHSWYSLHIVPIFSYLTTNMPAHKLSVDALRSPPLVVRTSEELPCLIIQQLCDFFL